MSAKRNFDLIIFGASGFTGKHVVSAVARLCGDFQWAIAGRNEEKLKNILNGLSLKRIPEIITADVNDEDSLKAMTERTKVLINVVGPYRNFGEPVVKACVATSTSLVDLCGEPEFLERTQLKYHQPAIDAGCLIVQSCGFDSIPADLGMVKLAQHFEPNGVLTRAESFLTAKGGDTGLAVHYTTYEAAVLGFGSVEDLKNLRQQSTQQKLNYIGSKLEIKRGPFSDERVPNRSCYLFMGSDSAVIRRTQEQLTKDNPDHVSPRVGVYFTIEEGMMNNAKMMLYGGTFQFLSKFQSGRDMLLKYPKFFSNGVFSHEGPSEQQIKNTTFEMTIFGVGFSHKSKLPSSPQDVEISEPDRKVTLRISGPEPGYIATSSLITLAALNILKAHQNPESSQLPRAGVFTPGYALRHDDSFMNGMKHEGIHFDFIEESKKEAEQ